MADNLVQNMQGLSLQQTGASIQQPAQQNTAPAPVTQQQPQQSQQSQQQPAQQTQAKADTTTSSTQGTVLSGKKHKGKCKFFDTKKGFGFITPDDESSDVFVHQSNIHAQGYRSLDQDEPVEYQLQKDTTTGKTKAVKVTGPGGDFVKGASRRPRGNYSGGRTFGRGRGGGYSRGRGGGYNRSYNNDRSSGSYGGGQNNYNRGQNFNKPNSSKERGSYNNGGYSGSNNQNGFYQNQGSYSGGNAPYTRSNNYNNGRSFQPQQSYRTYNGGYGNNQERSSYQPDNTRQATYDNYSNDN